MSSVLLKQQVKRRVSFGPLLRNRWNLLLILPLVLILLSFFSNAPFLIIRGPESDSLELPELVDTEGILAEYLISEPIEKTSEIELHPEILKQLKISSYRVRAGDTLSVIAQKFGLNVDTVISFNNIRNARNLLAGRELRVPNKDGLRYKVRRGDSLGKIARVYGIRLESLVDWNGLTSAVIVPGQELFIPGVRLSTNARNLVLGKLFVYPTRGRLTSRFGYRPNPFTGVREFHNGLDVGNIVGTRINAAMHGKVARIGYYAGLGKFVILIHPDGYQTLYGHLNKISVKRGMRISQGQKIGEMGNTGYSTGPHLHFTIFKNSAPVDPLKYLH
jgi:murein DD-endopeptidase MepM/ murein hydrolase activator NlpD